MQESYNVEQTVTATVAGAVLAPLVLEGAGGMARGVDDLLARRAAQQSKPAVVTEAALLERRMELIADSDFGPLNRPTAADIAASAGDRVVTFGGSNMPRYVDRPDATLGGRGGTVWAMPIDDAAALRTRADGVTQTGRAPGVTNSFRTGEPMYGLSIPSEHVPLRHPTSMDAGANAHFRAGGYTGVSRRNGWYQNPTHEIVTDGGRPMPEGTVFFEFNPDGSWSQVRRW